MLDHDDQNELQQLEELTAPKALRARYLLQGRMESPGSTSGLVAERARQGLATRPADGSWGDGGAVQRAELAWLLGLCRDLSPAEERACAIKYGGVGEHVEYQQHRRIGDVREGDGEEIVDVRPRDLDGNPMDGWVRVRGTKTRLPKEADIAAVMAREGWRNADGNPMSPGAAEKLLRTASEKVAVAIRARQAMAAWEERASG